MLLADQPQVTSTPMCIHNNNTQQISYLDNSHTDIDFNSINTSPTWKICENTTTTDLVPFQKSSDQTLDDIFADFMLQAGQAKVILMPVSLTNNIIPDESIIDWDLYASFLVTRSNLEQYIVTCSLSFPDHLTAYHFHPTFMIPSLLPPPEPPPTTSRFIFFVFQLGICF